MQLIYTVYDKKLGTYFKPMFTSHLAEITRGLTEAVNDPASNLCKYPSDFEMFQLGTYEETTGKIEVYEKPTFILNISELKKEETNVKN